MNLQTVLQAIKYNEDIHWYHCEMTLYVWHRGSGTIEVKSPKWSPKLYLTLKDNPIKSWHINHDKKIIEISMEIYNEEWDG